MLGCTLYEVQQILLIQLPLSDTKYTLVHLQLPWGDEFGAGELSFFLPALFRQDVTLSWSIIF